MAYVSDPFMIWILIGLLCGNHVVNKPVQVVGVLDGNVRGWGFIYFIALWLISTTHFTVVKENNLIVKIMV